MEMAGEEETPDEAVRKGLGTSATRAGVLEKLVRIGMIERRGDQKAKYLIPTHKGTALITVMPEMVKSPYMTAEWEQKLLAIEKNAYAADIFIEEIGNMLRKLIMTYEMVKDAELLAKPVKEVIGKCPCCGSDVIEYSKAFCCKNRNCKFSLWKNNRFFTSISKQMNGNIAKQLLQNGKTSLKKCKSLKTGKIFDCVVTMSVNPDEQVQFGFENNGK